MSGKGLIAWVAGLLAIIVVGTGLVAWRVMSLSRSGDPGASSVENLKAGNLLIGGTIPTDLTLLASDGSTVTIGSLMEKDRFLVINFHHPDCPCAANCGALISEMVKAGYHDVKVVGVLSSGHDDARVMTALRRQIEDGEITFPVYIDRDRSVQKAFGATRTPEVWVLDRDGKIAYWGAPENTLFPGMPGHRYYLREVVDALRANVAPPLRSSPPIGCLIES
jgi:peroxiredoxin